MRIRIPKHYDIVMDWIACHILPPPKPTGFKIFGYAVTWLDLAMIAYPTVAALALSLYYDNWLWFPAVAGSMALARIAWGVLWGWSR